ncbi:MAG: peptide/nickel transport system permease protein [Bacillota bacterium]|nr:peptide/nickel transport system permease protein [Bacillota bacterium]
MTSLATLAAVEGACDTPVEVRGSSLWRDAWRRLLRNRSAVAGGVLVLALAIVALAAPLLAPYDPLAPSLEDRLSPPSAAHWLGTDDLGRDILSRIIFGARVSLQVGILAVALALVAGTFLGIIAGYYGGFLDNLIMRIMDVMLAFPSVLLAIAIVAIMGPSLGNAMIAIGIVSIPVYARIVRSSTLQVKASEYVEAARALGGSDVRIIFRHVLPNCMAPLIVQASLGIATAILDAAGLSFLGLGAQPPTPEWGAMLSGGRAFLRIAPWVTAFPGIAIVLLVMGFNMFGDGLRDALDPRLKR